MCLFHCLASTLPHSFRVSVSLLSKILSINLSNSAKNSVLSVSCAPSTDVSGYAPACLCPQSPQTMLLHLPSFSIAGQRVCSSGRRWFCRGCAYLPSLLPTLPDWLIGRGDCSENCPYGLSGLWKPPQVEHPEEGKSILSRFKAMPALSYREVVHCHRWARHPAQQKNWAGFHLQAQEKVSALPILPWHQRLGFSPSDVRQVNVPTLVYQSCANSSHHHYFFCTNVYPC